jgi:hypothetical protein
VERVLLQKWVDGRDESLARWRRCQADQGAYHPPSQDAESVGRRAEGREADRTEEVKEGEGMRVEIARLRQQVSSSVEIARLRQQVSSSVEIARLRQ